MSGLRFRFDFIGQVKFSKISPVEKESLVMEFREGLGAKPPFRRRRCREATYSVLAGPGRSPGNFWGFKSNCKGENEKFE